MAVRLPPSMASGASRPPLRPVILAPICRSGSTTRAIGRLLSEASPVMTEKIGWPASSPAIRRIVVPELPQSSGRIASREQPAPPDDRDARRPFAPVGSKVTSTPSARRQSSVERQSAPGR